MPFTLPNKKAGTGWKWLNNLSVRGLNITPPLILAPMAGLTHSALRCLILKLGGAGLLTTEMLSAKGLPNENPRISPFLIRKPHEKPLSYQLLIRNSDEIIPAIEKLHILQADSIDINMGCPAPDVKRTGGGCSLMDDIEKSLNFVKIARKATHLPLTAKIRLGKELNEQKLADFCKGLEDEGIDMLTVHARLAHESFDRMPRWDWIARVKTWLKIPVIANGGILSAKDAAKCLEISGADGLMVGRAAAMKPWIFRDIAMEIYGIAFDNPTDKFKLSEIYGFFVRELTENFPPERQLGRLKEFTYYFSKNYHFGHVLAMKVQSARTVKEAFERAENFFSEG